MMLSKVGNARGTVQAKENRAQRLINSWDAIRSKMERIATKRKGLDSLCALGVLLIMETGIRVGNAASAKGFTTKPHPGTKERSKFLKTYGLTTLTVGHTRKRNGEVRLDFAGKKGVRNQLATRNCAVVKSYNRLVAGKKQGDLFLGADKYQLADFVKREIGKFYQVKDLRTAMVNIRFAANIASAPRRIKRKTEVKRIMLAIVEVTAESIGHTRGVCKASYISKFLWAHLAESFERRVK